MKILMFLVLLCYISTVYVFNNRLNVVEEEYNKLTTEYEQVIQDLETDVEESEITLIKTRKKAKKSRHYRVKISYYVPSAGGINSSGNRKKTAIGERPVPGKTLAVSRDLKHLLRKRIHIPGRGVFYANDLMAKRNPYTGKLIRRQIDICVRRLRDVPKQGVFKNIPIAVRI